MRYTDAIAIYCESLTKFPQPGVKRDDIRPGLCIKHYQKCTAIAFEVSTDLVSITGVFYGGQNDEAALRVVAY